jgi:hypothetical protein
MPFSLDLEAEARSLAGLKGYIINLAACPVLPASLSGDRSMINGSALW